jgi:hypothetical protein
VGNWTSLLAIQNFFQKTKIKIPVAKYQKRKVPIKYTSQRCPNIELSHVLKPNKSWKSIFTLQLN